MTAIPSPPVRNNRKRLLQIAGSLISFALLCYVLSQQGWREVLATVQQLSWQHVVAAGALIGISRLAVAMRWHILLRGMGIRMTPRESLALTFAGLYSANFLPTTVGGDVVRLTGAYRANHDSMACMASLMLDRVIGLIGMMMAAPLGVPFLHQYINRTACLDVPVIGAALPVFAKNFLAKFKQRYARLLRAFAIGLRRPVHLFGALAMTWVHMLCLFGAVMMLLTGLGQPLPFTTVMGLWAIVYVVTLLPISVNGLGVQELGVVLAFSSMGGVTEAAAAGMALLIRILMVLASLPGALVLPSVIAGQQAGITEPSSTTQANMQP